LRLLLAHLLALLKLEPERRLVLGLMFRNDDGTDKVKAALSLTRVLEPLVGLARSYRKR